MTQTRLIKICGLKTPEAVDAVIRAGASHAGFIFFEKSPRHVTIEQAAALAVRAKAGGLAPVAVTVDADDATLLDIARIMKPALIQLHGHETPERAAAIKALTGVPVMKAISVSTDSDLAKASPFEGIVERFLFDAKPPKDAVLPGGNAVRFDWSILKHVPARSGYLLAGGLDAGNVGDAIRIANPPGLDVSSGVETAPGVKDSGLIAAFCTKVRHHI
jgi:phosphoribosylanthranilate isomerase